MTTLKRISLLLALGACLAAAGCGDDEEGAPIPADQVAALEGQLAETEARLANGSVGACEDILNETMPEVGGLLDALPNDVDPEVRDALEQSFDNLWSMVDSECQDREPDEPAQTTPTQTEPEVTETTETVPTTPTETTDTTETDPEEEETLPPDGDGDSGGAIPGTGNGGGVGPGAGEEGGE